jgi:RNA polymerase sigma factor (TIGR02999 family)
MNEVTGLLSAIEEGDPQAAERLLPLVYDELRKLAARRLAREKLGQTLQPTALVHEAYLRLVDASVSARPQWDGRGHFFAAAAQAMRRILVENARRKGRRKHGGDRRREPVELDQLSDGASPQALLDLHEALERFAEVDPSRARLVELRFFTGMTLEEAASCLGVSLSTADRSWRYARAWLYDAMNANDPEQP